MRAKFDRVLILGGKRMSQMRKFLVKTRDYDDFQSLLDFCFHLFREEIP